MHTSVCSGLCPPRAQWDARVRTATFRCLSARARKEGIRDGAHRSAARKCNGSLRFCSSR